MESTAGQQRVLAHQSGWLQVRGPAGTGKTTSLVQRWRQTTGASGRQDRVLVLCRSRSAAGEFGRLALGDRSWAAEGFPVTTSYGAAFDIVRRHRGDRRLLTRAEQWSLVRRLLAHDDTARWPSCPDFVGRAAFVDEVASAVLAIEASGAGDDAILDVAAAAGARDRWADLLEFRHRYRETTAAMEALDGAQLLAEAVAILSDPAGAQEESARWDEVLVDDAEQVSGPAGRMIDGLAPSRLIAAGDAWRSQGRGLREPPISATWFERPAWRSAVDLGPRHRGALTPALVRCSHPSMEPEAIAGVLLEAHCDGVAWHDMAVLMRSEQARGHAIGRALARHGVPAAVTSGSLAAEPAVRAMIDFFSWAAGDAAAFDRLLVSPALDFGLGELRQLRRSESQGGPALSEHPRVARVVALKDSMVPRLAAGDPSDLAHEAWVVLLGALVEDPSVPSIDLVGGHALDAVVAFLRGVTGRAGHDPSWRIADELALVEGPEFDPDPWLADIGRPDADQVTIGTIWSAGGRSWDTVVIAGCLEGELPRLSAAARFFDAAIAERAATPQGSGAQLPPPTRAQRRADSLDEERWLFATATSRARRRLVATAAPAPGQLTSRFLAGATPAQILRARPRVAAGTFALVPAGETEGLVPIHGDGRLKLSASRLMTYDDCPRRYFYQYTLGVRGAGGVAASMGTIVHASLAAFLDPRQAVERSWASLEAVAQLQWRDAGGDETIAPYQPMREQARRDVFTMLEEWWRTEATRAEASGAWPEVVAVEYPFDIQVGDHRVRGSIDRIDRVPGGLAIIDYKTGSKVPPPADVAEDLQLATYHLAAVRDPALVALGEPVSLQLCYLRSGATPGQRITPDHAARTEQKILDVAERILAEQFEPSVTADCEYCDFWRLCPLQLQGRQVGGE